MSELGDIVGKNPQRKFVGVSVSRILGSEKGGSARKFKMGSLEFKNLAVPGRKAVGDANVQGRLAELEKSLTRKQKELDALKKEMAAAVEAARKDGWAQGEAAGRESATGELKANYDASLKVLENQIKSSLESISKGKEDLFTGFEEQVTGLVVDSLRQILGTNALHNQDAVISAVAGAVRSLGESHRFSVRVHPDDFKTISDSRNLWLPLSGNFEDISVEDDDRIERGCCIIETEHTSVEVSYRKILEYLEKEFNKIYRGRKDHPAPTPESQEVSGASSPGKDEGTRHAPQDENSSDEEQLPPGKHEDV